MTDWHILLATAGVLGLEFLVLSILAGRQRYLTKTMLGDGEGVPEKHALLEAVRAHGNFAEYVPLCLLLIGGLAMANAASWFVALLSAGLVVGRLLHPFGLHLPAPNPFRAIGVMLTWAVLLAASIAVLVIAL